MNSILLQVQQYLNSVSKNPVKLDKQLLQEFGEACKNALLKQFEENRKALREKKILEEEIRQRNELLQKEKAIGCFPFEGRLKRYNFKIDNEFLKVVTYEDS